MKVYKPFRLEEEYITLIDNYFVGENLTAKLEGVLNNFKGCIEHTKKELVTNINKEGFMYFSTIIEVYREDFRKENIDFKELLMLKVQEDLATSRLNENFNLKFDEVMSIVQNLNYFSAYTLVYVCMEYNSKYSQNDINNAYFNYYFS